MKDLSPGEWHSLIQRMYNDPKLFQIMFKYTLFCLSLLLKEAIVLGMLVI